MGVARDQPMHRTGVSGGRPSRLDNPDSPGWNHGHVLARAPVVLLGPGDVGHPPAVVVAEAPCRLGAGPPPAVVFDLHLSRRVEGPLLEESDDGHHVLWCSPTECSSPPAPPREGRAAINP